MFETRMCIKAKKRKRKEDQASDCPAAFTIFIASTLIYVLKTVEGNQFLLLLLKEN